MIKVGQIYQFIMTGDKWVITKGSYGEDIVCENIPICMIRNDGEVTTGYVPYSFFMKTKLIAEYPTWQEAVNSKEFKEE